jgi:hypothetical protein
MKYVRLYADSAGESHFADVDVELTPLDFPSPVPPLHLSSSAPATGYGFVSTPEGWHRDRRPTLRRELYFYLAGEIESRMSDGEVRRFGPGSITLVEDTTGKGHASRVLGTGGALFAVVHLAD